MNPLVRRKFDRALDKSYSAWKRKRTLWQLARYIERCKVILGEMEAERLADAVREPLFVAAKERWK